MQDVRVAVRQLAKNPGFALVAILTLAIGVASSVSIVSIANGVLWKPLPFPEPDRLVRLFENHRQQNLDFIGLSAPAFVDWRSQNSAFEDLAAYQPAGFDLTLNAQTRRIPGARVSASFFPLLRVNPALGRAFAPEEDSDSRKQVALLSHKIWREQFNSSPAILGTPLIIDGANLTIVGVLPANFEFPGVAADVWTPMGFEPFELENRGGHNYQAIGRLKPNVTLDAATAQIQAISARLSEQHDLAKGWNATLVSLHESFFGNTRKPLNILLGAVVLVLLIACSNVANLLLARALVRKHEFALRLALGASRPRIIRQLLCESALLALSSAAAGWLLAYWILSTVSSFTVSAFPRLETVALNWPMTAFTIGLSLLTGFAFGLAPAWYAFRSSLSGMLKESDHRSASEQGGFFRATFVVAQIALSLALLIGASLLIRSFARLQSVDLGYKPEHILTAALAMPNSRFPRRDADRRQFLERVVERVSTLPGVESAASVMGLPMSFIAARSALTIEGRPPRTPGQMEAAGYSQLSTNYFKTIGATLLRGRQFHSADTVDTPMVMIVNERFAQTFFPGENPIGKRLFIMDSLRERPTEIVGIVRNLRQRDLVAEPAEEMYFPVAQRCWAAAQIVIRTQVDPAAMEKSVRQTIAEIDPLQTVFQVQTMETLLNGAMQQRQLQTTLLASFACIALILSAIGIYSVMAYMVAQRTHEIGIRLSLGAATRQIIGFVLRQGLRLALAGIILGLAGAWALSDALQSALFEIAPTDPATFLFVPAIMIATAVLACWIPARRAARLDPVAALRDN